MTVIKHLTCDSVVVVTMLLFSCRTGGATVSSEDIVIAGSTDTSDGVQVDVYARLRSGAGILPRTALERSTQV